MLKDEVKEKLARSLTADTTDLLPYLPYLLQDFWELGSSPEDMLNLFRKHIPVSPGMRVLDLGCGKGAVSIRLAQELGISFKGIDLMPEFIDQARAKATELGLSELCSFEVGEAGESLKNERDYDCLIFGAVGNILGDHQTTLQALTAAIKKGGYLLFDDAYILDKPGGPQLNFEQEYPTYEQWQAIFKALNLELIDCLTSSDSPGQDVERDMGWISARAEELIKLHPAEKALFEQYVENQRNEYLDLEQELVGATWLLRTEKPK